MDNLDELKDVRSLRNRRGVRKRCATATLQFLNAAQKLPLSKIVSKEVEKKLDQVVKNFDSYTLVQCKLIDLLAEQKQDDDVELEENDYAEMTTTFSDMISDLGRLLEARKLMKNMIAVSESTDQLMRHGSLTGPAFRDEARKFLTKIDDLRTERTDVANEYRDELAESWEQLVVRQQALLELMDKAITESKEDAGATSTKTSSTDHTVSRLPRIEFPIFSGDPMDWAQFWQQFNACLNRAPGLADEDRVSYLRTAVKGREGTSVLEAAPGTADKYDDLVRLLEARFDQKRLVYRTHLERIFRHKVNGRSRDEWQRLQLTLMKSLNALKQSGQFNAEHIITALVETTLDEDASAAWLDHTQDLTTVPSLEKLLEFIEREIRALPVSSKTRLAPASQPNKKPPARSAVFNVQRDETCAVCHSAHHQLFACTTFRNLPQLERYATAQRLRACINCLSFGHGIKTCYSKSTCRDCGKKHNTLLHRAERPPLAKSETVPSSMSLPAPLVTITHKEHGEALFLTGRGVMQTPSRSSSARIFFDSGANATLITQKLANTLRAKPLPGTVSISGITGFEVPTPCKRTIVELRTGEQDEVLTLTAIIVEKIIADQPTTPLSIDRKDPIFADLELSDPSFDKPGPVELLVGLRVFNWIVQPGLRRTPDKNITIYPTTLGWLVSCNTGSATSAARVHVTTSSTLDEVEHQFIQSFWTIEHGPAEQSPLSKEEQRAVEHFDSTVSRKKDGRYEVQLPRKESFASLGRSREQAARRFIQNEKSLVKKDQWPAFEEVVHEYQTLQHAEPVPPEDLCKPFEDNYYLPMHGVTKESSTTTKLRVVFDASAKTSSGVSLNDTLLPGPNLYPLLNEVLLKFRNNAIGMSADISKMFREISLHPQERDFHRFLWRNAVGRLTDWRMTRLTFGVASSPFLATRVLRQMAADLKDRFPNAADIMQNEFYVDDCLTGAATAEAAISIRKELNNLMQEGAMTLRKWRTSSAEVLNSIPEPLREEEQPMQAIAVPSQCHKALGVHWNTILDTLHVATPSLESNSKSTRRQIASELARTFDIMGWFAPAILVPKALIQSLWKLGTGWDESVPPDIDEAWREWKQQLPMLTAWAIPRFYFKQNQTVQAVQLHGFSDASKRAYACVIYVRAFYTDATVSVSLVTAKSRLAPIKEMTIPRLELCGAQLLGRVMEATRTTLKIDSSECYAWCDSNIALAWINHDSGKLQTFVANRVNDITSKIEPSQWKYVPTAENPADAASRGLLPRDLLAHTLWWDGPPWLSQPPLDWPARMDFLKKKNLPELKKNTSPDANILTCTIQSTPLQLTERISSWLKLRRVMAWVLRIANQFKYKIPFTQFPTHPLQVSELNAAEQAIIRIEQLQFFDNELTSLRRNGVVSTRSGLSKLLPFVDANGLLRVGGRLQRADSSFDVKHPYILHQRAPTVKLLIRWFHLSSCHSGASEVMGLMARMYYVVGARRAVRSITQSCVECRKVHAKTSSQLMGQLPPSRINQCHAFQEVGIDFAGPLTAKKGHTRRPVLIKAYVCLFVCMATKAIHLEPVGDLTTQAFLDSLHRFVARRGRPQVIHCDNGTNFVGAEGELNEIYRLLQEKECNDRVHRDLADQGVLWDHIPGKAPHFGGLWESSIKSMKLHLRKTVGSHRLTVEEMFTILAKIESSLNSRPLVPLDNIPADGSEVLTPGHFLIGRPLLVIPTSHDVRPQSLGKRWTLCQRLAKEVWDLWSRDYVAKLNQMAKWSRPTRCLQVGDVVLLKDQELFMNSWPLGRVMKTHPGPDGRVRAVDVRAKGSEYRRPIHKLVLLLPEDGVYTSSSQAPEDGHA